MFASGCAHHDPIRDSLGHRGCVGTPEPAACEAGTIGQVQEEWVASSYLPLACKRIFLARLPDVTELSLHLVQHVAVIFHSTAGEGLNILCLINNLCDQWLFSMVSLIFLQVRVQFITASVLGFDLFLCASMREVHSLSPFAKEKGPRMDDKIRSVS